MERVSEQSSSQTTIPKSRTKLLLLTAILLLIFLMATFLIQRFGVFKKQGENILPDKLIITRPEDRRDHLFSLMKTFTNNEVVTTLYRDIYKAPILSSLDPPPSCPFEWLDEQYFLDFYQNTRLLLHVIYNTSGCRKIEFNNHEIRVAIGSGVNFTTDLQQALGLSDKDFYGLMNAQFHR